MPSISVMRSPHSGLAPSLESRRRLEDAEVVRVAVVLEDLVAVKVVHLCFRVGFVASALVRGDERRSTLLSAVGQSVDVVAVV